MKHTLILLAAITLLSCSSDDNNCEGNKADINANYDEQVQYVIDNPGPNGVDYRQIESLNEERNRKLENACD